MNSDQMKAHYDAMWTSSLEKFQKQEFEIDSLIDAAEDDRYGMTLLARPPQEIKNRIVQFLDDVSGIAPHQYFYPRSDIHLTILSIISCYPGFSLENIRPDLYAETIGKEAESIEPFEVHFKGITASPSCIMIQGFTENDKLETLRNKVRTAFGDSTLSHSIDKRYTIQTAHLTVGRFHKPVQKPEKFISVISQYRGHDFGSCMIDELELVGNNWYHQKEKVQLIKRFKLS